MEEKEFFLLVYQNKKDHWMATDDEATKTIGQALERLNRVAHDPFRFLNRTDIHIAKVVITDYHQQTAYV